MATVAAGVNSTLGFLTRPPRRPLLQLLVWYTIVISIGGFGIGSGLFASIGILAALQGARTTGVGQRVDIAMMDSVIALMDMVPFNPSMGITDNQLSAWPGICASFRAKDGLTANVGGGCGFTSM